MKLAFFLILSAIYSNAYISAPINFVNKEARNLLRPLSVKKYDENEVAAAARAARKAGPNDRVVEIRKPLGLVLEQDDKGDVYVAKINENSNAESTKKVYEGDKISFVSATFGDELWSVRGAGIARVQKAIRVRQGNTVTLVLENPNEAQAKKKRMMDEAKQKREVKEDQQAKRDRLLAELEKDTKEKSKKFFGLF